MKLVVTIQDLFGVWGSIEDRFRGRLPLDHLHWKSQNRPLRSISSLDLDLQPYEVVPEDKAIQDGDLLERPVLNIFVVKCDDVEIYRSHARQLIRDWYNTVVTKPNQQWLILHVLVTEPAFGSAGPARSSGTKFLGLKNSVFDKIRSDFNTSTKKDQCAQLRLGDGKVEFEEALNELFIKVKDLIMASLTSKIEAIEGNVHQVKSGTRTSNLNFYPLFNLKESLAKTFQSMSLLEDALVQYDEIESSFYEVVTDRHLDNFGGSGGFDEKDLTGPVLDLQRKPYKELISQNKITIFDFRVYVFARQAILLVTMRHFAELLTRSLSFVASLGRSLDADRATFDPYFIESWIYNVVDCILSLVPQDHYDRQTAAARGDVLSMQKSALIKLGRTIAEGQDAGSEPAPADFDFSVIKNTKLRSTLETPERFSSHMQALNESILVDYKFAERPHGVALLNIELAQSFLAANDYGAAARHYESAIDFQSQQSWYALHETYVLNYLDCLKYTAQNTKCVQVCLEILSKRKLPEIAGRLVTLIDSLSTKIDQDLEAQLSDFGTVAISRFTQTSDNVIPAISIDLTFDSFLPRSIEATRVELVLKSETTQNWTFSASSVVVNHGKTALTLQSSHYFPGNYTASHIEVHWGQIRLTQDLEAGSSYPVAIYTNDSPIKVEIQRQKVIILDQPRQIALSLQLGAHEVKECSLKIESLSMDFELDFSAATLTGNTNSSRLEPKGESLLQIEGLQPYSKLTLDVPYKAKVPVLEIALLITVSYTLAMVEHVIVQRVATDLYLPLAVNVQDFFRKESLCSKFQVTCTNNAPIRLIECNLASSAAYSVDPGLKRNTAVVLLSGHPCIDLFHIRPDNVSTSQPLRLRLRYRRIFDEILFALHEHAMSNFAEISLSKVTEGILLHACDEFMKYVDVQMSALLGRVMLSSLEPKHWSDIVSTIRPQDRSAASALIQGISTLDTLSLHGEADNDRDQYVEIPVEIPTQVVVHQAAIRIDPGILKLGEPANASLEISSTSVWYKGEFPPGLTFTYDIEIDDNCWIMVGRKHSTFTAEDVINNKIKLIPLRAGNLLYPAVDIQSCNDAILSETHLVSNNTEALVVGKEGERIIQF